MKVKQGGDGRVVGSDPAEVAKGPTPPLPGAQASKPAAPEQTRRLFGDRTATGSGAAGDVGRGLDVAGKDRSSLFALQLRKGNANGAEAVIGPLPKVGVSTIGALLAKLPVQAEVQRIVAAQRAPGAKIPFRPFDEMKADLPAVFVKALERLPGLSARFNPVELYTADGVAALKETFIADYQAGERYNPTFTYEEGTRNLRASLARDGTSPEAIRAELVALRAQVDGEPVPKGEALSDFMRQSILRKIDDDLSTLDLLDGLESKDDAKIRDALGTKYGRGVEPALYDAAKVVFAYLVENQSHAKAKAKKGPAPRIDLPEDLAAHLSKNETMTAAEFKGAVDWMLGRYYATYEAKTGRPFPKALMYKVEIDDKFSAIDVRDKSSEGPIIGIPDKDRSPKKYLELLRHEIDMHARQSLNGHFMFGFGGGALKVDEETWYEGLAKHADITLMQQMFGDDSQPTMPYYPFAIRMAEEGKSFIEVFEAMYTLRLEAGSSDKIAVSNAWNTAYRVFRGHIDTANPHAYAMPKDQAYLRGWMLQSQLAERGLSYLNEAAIGPPDGPERLCRFDFGPDDLMFPDVDLTRVWFEEKLRPKAEAEMAAAQDQDDPES